MASSHGSTWLRRRMLWLLVASMLPFVLSLGVAVASAKTPSAATLQVTCTPDTFRPYEWTVVECTTIITNNSQNEIPGGYLYVRSVNGPIPMYFWMSLLRDGEYVPVGTGELGFETVPLKPGQSSESHLIGLLWMSLGTWSGGDSLVVGDQEIASLDLQLTAANSAAAPPQDLLVTKSLIKGPSNDGTSPRTAVYETKITNQSASTITSLKITDRTENVDLLEAEPPPASRNDALHLATWDLASFGRDSLAPGESLVLRMTYGPGESGCSFTSSGVVVEADVDGKTERFGTRPEKEVSVGNCDYGVVYYENGAFTSAETGGPIAFGRGGEGPSDSAFDVLWAATFLAAAGTSLVGLATLVRRRVRR